MADVELIIKIPEEVKNRLCFGITYPKDIQVICEALNNSVLLPKGHGRLGDLDALAHEMLWAEIDNLEDKESVAGLMLRFCDKAQPIIEADKESEVEE